MARLLLLNGPNLNLLGTREPQVYGANTLAAIEAQAADVARARPAMSSLPFRAMRSTSSSSASTRPAREQVDFLIFNPGGFTHTSVALRDALLAVKLPFIEVHLSNTQAREPFRHHSYFTDIAVGCISGLGAFGYELAVRAAVAQLSRPAT